MRKKAQKEYIFHPKLNFATFCDILITDTKFGSRSIQQREILIIKLILLLSTICDYSAIQLIPN